MQLVSRSAFNAQPPQCQGPNPSPPSLPTCSHIHASWFGKYLYVCSRSEPSILLHSSMNLGQRWSHEACPDMLQLAHQNLSWSVSVHLAILCSFPHVQHISLNMHLATRWLAFNH